MKTYSLHVIIALCLLNCQGSNVNNVKTDSSPIPANEVTSIKNNNGDTTLLNLSGVYGDASIAQTSDTITGVYEYYDKWDKSSKQFTDVNVFYFFGVLTGGHIANVTIGWPDEDINYGTLILTDTAKIALREQPNGYAAFDFVKIGYNAKRDSKTKWKEIRIVKSERAYFYNEPNNTKKTKVYIVKSDIVKVFNEVDGWYQIEYSPINERSKRRMAWILKDDLYARDPKSWN